MNTRRQQAQYIRNNAAELAANRPHPQHINNKEEYEYRRPKKDGNEPSHIANFTKGLPHDEHTGLLLNSADYDQFVLGIQSGDTTDFARTPLGPAELPKVHGCLSNKRLIVMMTTALDSGSLKLLKELRVVMEPSLGLGKVRVLV